MAEPMRHISFNISESEYLLAKEQAEIRGYLSVEEYVSDWLKEEGGHKISLTPELKRAIEEGRDDVRAGRVLSLEEVQRRHADRIAKQA